MGKRSPRSLPLHQNVSEKLNSLPKPDLNPRRSGSIHDDLRLQPLLKYVLKSSPCLRPRRLTFPLG